MIAAVYAALTVLVSWLPSYLGSGLVQFRVSEALTVLAALTPAAVPGLALGSVLANTLSLTAVWPIALLDVVFGSLGTTLGALWTWRFRDRTWLALAGPVVCNALIVPAYLPFTFAAAGLSEVPFLNIGVGSSWLSMYALGVLTVGIGQAVVVYTLGWGLLSALRRFVPAIDRQAG